jgi:Ca2+-binding RTX toxin-like protein
MAKITTGETTVQDSPEAPAMNTAGEGAPGSQGAGQPAATPIAVPAPGESIAVTVAPGEVLSLESGVQHVEFADADGDLVVVLANGGKIILEDLATAAGSALPPVLTLADGTVMSADDLLVQALDGEILVDIEPVAGPDAAQAAANTGAGFRSFNADEFDGSESELTALLGDTPVEFDEFGGNGDDDFAAHRSADGFSALSGVKLAGGLRDGSSGSPSHDGPASGGDDDGSLYGVVSDNALPGDDGGDLFANGDDDGTLGGETDANPVAVTSAPAPSADEGAEGAVTAAPPPSSELDSRQAQQANIAGENMALLATGGSTASLADQAPSPTPTPADDTVVRAEDTDTEALETDLLPETETAGGLDESQQPASTGTQPGSVESDPGLSGLEAGDPESEVLDDILVGLDEDLILPGSDNGDALAGDSEVSGNAPDWLDGGQGNGLDGGQGNGLGGGQGNGLGGDQGNGHGGGHGPQGQGNGLGGGQGNGLGGGQDNGHGGGQGNGHGGGQGSQTNPGGSGDDTLIGGAGPDSLDGNAGDDLLDGGAGDDTLDGGAGDDSLIGRTGADSLFGNSGADLLDGGAGSDTLTGGSGKDTFVVGADQDLGTDVDHVTDFWVGTNPNSDVLDLSSVVNMGGGDDIADFVRTWDDGTDTHIEVSQNGDGVWFEVALFDNTVTDLATLLGNEQVVTV